jgi:hypothetical protein
MFSAWSTGPMTGIELIIELSFKIMIIITFIVTLTRVNDPNSFWAQFNSFKLGLTTGETEPNIEVVFTKSN